MCTLSSGLAGNRSDFFPSQAPSYWLSVSLCHLILLFSSLTMEQGCLNLLLVIAGADIFVGRKESPGTWRLRCIFWMRAMPCKTYREWPSLCVCGDSECSVCSSRAQRCRGIFSSLQFMIPELCSHFLPTKLNKTGAVCVHCAPLRVLLLSWLSMYY